MATDCSQQLTFWDLGPQQVTVDFAGGRVVTDAGLLPLRLLYKQLGVLSTIAQRLPDPRAQKLVTHTREALLTQEVYQILAGYPDGNDAQQVRPDPLFQTLVDVPPDAEQPLASGSTVNRFHHAYTCRQAELPLAERPVLREIDAALTQRLQVFDGESGFPLAAWLRPGTVHASCGVVATLRRLIAALRAAWPDVLILVRGDSSCEALCHKVFTI